jgi:hypothetical protein
MNLSDITIADVGRTLHIEGDPDSPYRINRVSGQAEVMFGPMYDSIEVALRNRHYRPNPEFSQVDDHTIRVIYTPDVEIQEITVTAGVSAPI